MSTYDFDWLVIGSGPAGEKAAVQAAYFGKRVAVVERRAHLGGACVHTGTLPSKTLRETALYLSGWRQRDLYGVHCQMRQGISLSDLMCRQTPVVETEAARIYANLQRHQIKLLLGSASFIDEHTVEIVSAEGERKRYSAEAILIATGSSPYRPTFVPFEDSHVNDSDTILRIDAIPNSLVIMGGGVIGCEYASIFAALGVKCTIIEGRSQILGFLDQEINQLLFAELTRLGCDIRLKRSVAKVERIRGVLTCTLDDGSLLACERLLFAGGRAGNTQDLHLENIGAVADSRGLLQCAKTFQLIGPKQGRIYAAGDVIGFPSLASVAMEQGRVAACQAFDFAYKKQMATLFPYGLYTIPEVSMVGETEQELQARGASYCVGRGRYRDNARGQIVGDTTGLLKLLVDRNDRKILGVHILGERATELVHLGQSVMHFGGTVEDFIGHVFNFPTLGELYKYAAYDALGSLQHYA